jgi:hypothetical protein
MAGTDEEQRLDSEDHQEVLWLQQEADSAA